MLSTTGVTILTVYGMLVAQTSAQYGADVQQCGDWASAYTTLHRQTLDGQATQKYLVVQTTGGLADGLVFISGMLYVALLTDRALQISEEVLPYSIAYDQPNVDWRESPKDEGLSVVQHEMGTTGALPLGNEIFEMAYNGSLRKLSPHADIIKIRGNTGIIAALFDNPYYRQYFVSMDFHPEDAFRCAVNFLFKPTNAVQEHFKHEFGRLGADHFSIGIQLRLGDSYLTGAAERKNFEQRHAAPELHNVQHFFDCAEQIEQSFDINGQEPVWYLVSDSLEIRQRASEAYGEKIMTHLTQPGHVWATDGQTQHAAMIQAAGENWLFGMTDYQIVSSISGFGKTGAMRKHSWHTIYRLTVHQIPEPGEVFCNGLTTHSLDFGVYLQDAHA